MDYRFKVFQKVAEKLSFTKAAAELYISQPAVTKHIAALEAELGHKLFVRKGSYIELTEAGKITLKYVRKAEKIFNELIFELSTLDSQVKGKLKIGSSSTMTQYILPKILADFKSKFSDLSISVINGNTQQIERALQRNEIDLGIVEGKSKRTDYQYIEFIRDEIVLVAKSSSKIAKKLEITLEELKSLPLVLREEGSGTLEVIVYNLRKKGLNLNDLNIQIRLGSTEAIKNYILHSQALSFLSIHSILNELKRNELSVIDIKDFQIKRHFNFILPKGEQNRLVELFIRFARYYNF